MAWKVYLAKLKRELPTGSRLPRCVYKVGITASKDAMDRLTYAREDEPHPISYYFPDIKVMKTIWCEDRTEAEKVEKAIMDDIKGDAQYFHDWYEPDQISGITEMRRWNYDEIQRIFELMDQKNQLLS